MFGNHARISEFDEVWAASGAPRGPVASALDALIHPRQVRTRRSVIELGKAFFSDTNGEEHGSLAEQLCRSGDLGRRILATTLRLPSLSRAERYRAAAVALANHGSDAEVRDVCIAIREDPSLGHLWPTLLARATHEEGAFASAVADALAAHRDWSPYRHHLETISDTIREILLTEASPLREASLLMLRRSTFFLLLDQSPDQLASRERLVETLIGVFPSLPIELRESSIQALSLFSKHIPFDKLFPLTDLLITTIEEGDVDARVAHSLLMEIVGLRERDYRPDLDPAQFSTLCGLYRRLLDTPAEEWRVSAFHGQENIIIDLQTSLDGLPVKLSHTYSELTRDGGFAPTLIGVLAPHREYDSLLRSLVSPRRLFDEIGKKILSDRLKRIPSPPPEVDAALGEVALLSHSMHWAKRSDTTPPEHLGDQSGVHELVDDFVRSFEYRGATYTISVSSSMVKGHSIHLQLPSGEQFRSRNVALGREIFDHVARMKGGQGSADRQLTYGDAE